MSEPTYSKFPLKTSDDACLIVILLRICESHVIFAYFHSIPSIFGGIVL